MKKINYIVNVLVLFVLIVLVGVLNVIDNKRYNKKDSVELVAVSDSNSKVEALSNEEPTESNTETDVAPEELTEEVSTDNIEETINPDIVYDGKTLEELGAQLDKSLHSDLTGTGYLFAKYSIQYNVNPYMAVAISLHETGCESKCNSKVPVCNNVGGQKFSPVCYAGSTYGKYDTLELGIEGFIRNLAVNYIDKGLDTPELMQAKYVGTGSTTWAPKVNTYMNKIRNR